MDCWLVTSHALALRVIRDAATYTVDDPRFSTGRVVGPSMLSLDGDEHARHRAPFAPPFRPLAVRDRFAELVTAEAWRLVEGLVPPGSAELRRSLAGPLAAYAMTRALGLEPEEVAAVLAWYDAIVSAVTEITAGANVPAAGREAFAALRDRLLEVIHSGGPGSLLSAAASDAALGDDAIVSNAA